MSHYLSPLLAAMALLLIWPASLAQQTSAPEPAERPCRAQPALAGACFRARGRLSLYNGAPAIRLWRAGTRRILGVSSSYASAGYRSIPPELEAQLTWDRELWGDFLVCPFTPRRPREMQMICIEEGRNIVVRERR